MSQVRKYAKGGGTITKGGVTYEYTPELAQELSQFLSVNGAQDLYEIVDGFANGDNIKINPNGTIQGVSAWSGDKNLDANVSNWRKNLDAWNNNRYHKIRSQLPILSGWIPNSNKQTTETPTNLTDIFGNRDWFEYNTDENGKKTYLNNSSKNNLLMQRLDNMTEYLSDEEAGKKKYKLGQEYDTQRMAGLRQLFNTNKDKWGTTVDTLKSRIQSGEDLTPEEIAFLENFNIAKGDGTSSGSGDVTGKLSAADRTKWNNAGFGGLADLLGGRAHLNDDGSLSLNEGEDWGWNLGALSGRNIWFNDDFYNTTYGASGEFDPYKNLTLYNGKLYSLNSPTLKRILDAEGGYNQLMKAGNWDAADNIILSRFTDAARENPAALDDDKYSTFLSGNPTYRFSNLTGLYGINGKGLTNGDQLIQYVDLNEDSSVGPYKSYNYKYKLLDNKGNARDVEIDPNTVTAITGGQSAGDLKTYNRIVGSNNAAYNNRYYEDILDKNDNATGFRFYRSIDDPNGDVILHMPKISATDSEDKDLKLPKEIAQVLMQNPTWINKVVGNAQNKKNFMDIMSGLVQSWWAQTDHFWFRNERAQLKKMGFTDQEAEQFLNAFNRARKGSRSQRRQDMLLDNTFKEGGVISDQRGGKAGGSKTATGVSEKKVNVENTNPQNAAGISEIGGKNWTSADTAELGALVADLGSLGLAFVPGANLGALGAGVAGSTARYYADTQRGTQGAGLNYLLNLGMDATMAIPILGGVTKTLRVPKLVAKALPTIVKAASIYGLGSGVIDAANKIASGEKFTVRDVDMLVNALTAGVGLTKSGGLGKSKQGKAIKDINIQNKTVTNGNLTTAIEGTAPFKISGKDLDGINTPDKFRQLVVNKAKAAGDTSVTLENVGERYDLSKFLEGKKWKPGFNPKTWFKRTESVTEFKPEATGQTEQAQTALGRWWRGETGMNKMYKKTLQGENKGLVVVNNTATRVYEPKTIKFNGKDVKFTPEEVEMIAKRSGDIKGLMKSKLTGTDKKNWVNLYREFMHNRNQTKLNVQNDAIPEWYRTRLSDQKLRQPGLGISVGPVRSRTRTYDTRMSINMPQLINPFTAANQQANRDVQPELPPVSYQPVFKKGGKIVKAQHGVNTSLLDMNILDSGFTNRMKGLTNKANAATSSLEFTNALRSGNQPKLNEISSGITNFKVPTPATKQNTVTIPGAENWKLTAKSPAKTATATKPQYDFGNVLGGSAGSTPYFDPTPIANWIGAGVANSFTNKQLNAWMNRYRGNPRDVMLNAPRFQLSGAGDAVRQSGKNQLYVKGNTSDWLQNESLRKAGQAAYNEALLKGNLQDAQEYAKYSQLVQNHINDEAKRHGEFANQVDNMRMQQSAADAQMKSNALALKSDIFNKAWYAQTQYNDQLAKQNAGISAQRDLQPKLQAIQTQYEQNLRAWQNKWGNNTDSEAAKAELQMIQANAMRQRQAYDMEYQNRALPSWARVKLAKGGKTGKDSKVTYSTTTSRDPYPELLIQNDKSTAQYVERLSEAVLKMILQTKPIHVS